MKRELVHCPLRFATAQAYDSVLSGPGSVWVERSQQKNSHSMSRSMLRMEMRLWRVRCLTARGPVSMLFDARISTGLCANPLHDEPDPVVVEAVRRFGLVGLVTCAVGTGLLRWWHSMSHRVLH